MSHFHFPTGLALPRHGFILFRPELRMDPAFRCAALSLLKDALAALPFYQSQADLDVMDQDYRARCV